jgi:quinolinate synthase
MNDQNDNKQIIDRIQAIRDDLGKKLLILTHHYQRKEIVALGDYQGDSFGLSQKAAEDKDAQYIVFCGVHFMAESAEILSQAHQTVQIPKTEAGCWMADMADNHVVTEAWDELTSITDVGSIMPIVYMNSDAELKAFCGVQGGTVCTSSNASDALRWAFSEREKVLFFPDQHLGRNTGNQMGIKPDEMILWNPKKPLGGNTPDDIKKAKMILWDGYCLVHTRFQVEHVTSYIVKYVKEAPPDTTIIIGTEINLINRLALEHPDKKIFELHYSLCPNMFKINLKNLLWTLENIGKVNVIKVREDIKVDSRLALDRMLDLAPENKSANGKDASDLGQMPAVM